MTDGSTPESDVPPEPNEPPKDQTVKQSLDLARGLVPLHRDGIRDKSGLIQIDFDDLTGSLLINYATTGLLAPTHEAYIFVVDPIPQKHDDSELYQGEGIKISNKDKKVNHIKAAYKKVGDKYVRVEEVIPPEDEQKDITEHDMQKYLQILQKGEVQKQQDAQDIFGRTNAELRADGQFSEVVLKKIQQLLTLIIDDRSMPYQQRAQSEGGEPARVDLDEVLGKVVYGANARNILSSKTVLFTRDGDIVDIYKAGHECALRVIPGEEANKQVDQRVATLYRVGEKNAEVTIELESGGFNDEDSLFAEVLGEIPHEQTKDRMTDAERARCMDILEGVYEDQAYLASMREEVKRVIDLEALRGNVQQDGSLLTTRYNMENGEAYIVTAETGKKGYNAMSIEQRLLIDPDNPNEIAAIMYYFDYAKGYAVMRPMRHQMTPTGGIDYDAAWGKLGLAEEEKNAIIRNPKMLDDYNLDDQQRQTLVQTVSNLK